MNTLQTERRQRNGVMAANLKHMVFKRLHHPRFRMTRGEIAARAGILERILWHLMSDKILIKDHHIAPLCKALGCKQWRLNPELAPKSLKVRV